ncbi:MAG: hypothetical protein KDD63_08895, partial [Bacteroidetes bacterium]|nr:hypothetical protein [Bacteroidota bacterium]
PIVEPVLSHESFLENLKSLQKGIKEITDLLISLGDTGFSYITKGKDIPEEEAFLAHQITYSWANQAKSYLILWRDVLFQHQKAHILFKEGKVKKEEINQLRQDSRSLLSSASQDLKAFIPLESQQVELKRNGISRQLRKWSKQENPWPAYQQQITKIPAQCERLVQDHQMLSEIADIYAEIKVHIDEALHKCKDDIDLSCSMIASCIETIEHSGDDSNEKKLTKIIQKLEEMDEGLSSTNYLNNLTDILEAKLTKIPDKKSIPVATEYGFIQLQELSFRKRTKQWLEAEILPLIYEVWELTDNFRNRTKMTGVNIRNRALLLQAEVQEGKNTEIEIPDIARPLHSFAVVSEKVDKNIAELRELVHTRLGKNFFVSEIYRLFDKFLPIPEQSAVSQLRLNQSKILENIQRWINRNVLVLYRFKRSVERDANLSISEKVVKYIENRKGDPNNNSYASIFLTKGYVGESFWVGRKDESAHIRSLIQNWQKGFRGAALVTGQRLSGKTLFGELVALRYFPKTTIRLIPGLPIEVNSRIMEGTHNLQEALNFIRKYAQNEQILIWIDDLELWWHPQTPLYKNVRHLNKFIDQYSTRYFFLVSIGNTLFSHLRKSHELKNVFQADINMDYMSSTDIEEAILIRHGATHKTLINAQGEEIAPREFQKLIRSVYRLSGG